MIDLNKLESYDLKDINGEFTNEKITKAKFRFLGPFGQGHNIVVYIRELSVRTNHFRKLVKRMILIDNRTR
jgi:hypothetical protein